MRRIALFLLTNLAVIVVLGVVLRLLGVDSLLNESGRGLNYTSLLIFAGVFGFGGAFISLAISKWMAKRSTGAQVITEPRTETERWLVATVQRQADKAGIKMPEVAIFHSPDPNAFATGMTKNSSLVAVSTGLLQHMDRDEVEAVLGHEIAHVANGDMVTLALVQGVVNTFVIFLARVVGYAVDQFLRRDDDSGGLGIGYYITSFIAEIVFGILASIIVMWVSRQREFRADAGGAQLAGRGKMIAALQKLQAAHPQPLPGEMAAFGISGIKKGGLAALFSSHPPLEQRIEALRNAA
ncbi:MAG: protease HtpX [Xanthomonadales bacterium]|nr:protease HtpX [Xanthomonadales bacterium]